MKPINATITQITPDGVWATWPTMEKPNCNDLILRSYIGLDGEIFYEWKADSQKIMQKRMKAYESSKVVSDVENVTRGKTTGRYFVEIEIEKGLKKIFLIWLNQSCSIIETGEGKCKIVKI